MGKAVKKIAAFLCLLCFGCTNTITSNVSVFHELPNNWSSKTIKVLPFDPKLKPSLEWKLYKSLIVVELEKRGFSLIRNNETTDYVAFASYGVDFGKTSTSSTSMYNRTIGGRIYSPGSIYGFDNGSSYFSGLGFTMPLYGVVDMAPFQTTIYSKNLALDIVLAESLNSENVKKLYEGRVASIGRCDNLPTIIPFMIKSLFKEFPGSKSGQKTVVSLPFEGSC